MKRILPGRVELACFAAMALVCGLLCSLSGKRDVMLFSLTVPVFIIAALLGLRRNQLLQAQEAIEEPEHTDVM